jgi:hypothetical protein
MYPERAQMERSTPHAALTAHTAMLLPARNAYAVPVLAMLPLSSTMKLDLQVSRVCRYMQCTVRDSESMFIHMASGDVDMVAAIATN